MTDLERLLSKVRVQPDGCWLYTKSITPRGYGQFWLDGKTWRAHRASWSLHGNPLPTAPLELDHKCHDPKTCAGGNRCLHRRCINPGHLQVSTKKNNNSPERANNKDSARANGLLGAAAQRAKTHCKYGHEYSPENTYTYHGRRQCITCNKKRELLRIRNWKKEHSK